MSNKTITTTISHRITLYDTGVTITDTGAIAPSGTGSSYSYDEGAITGTGVNITNDGTILGSSEYHSLAGIYLSFSSHNTIINYGLIQGGEGGFGVALKNGLLVNSGTIAAGTSGRYGDGGAVYFGGTFINSGLVVANNGSAGVGVDVYDHATIIDSGTINGGGGEAVEIGGFGELVVSPGAVFVGAVKGQTSDVLEVEGTSATAVSGVGTSFENFGTISFASGAAWTLGGDAAGLAAGQTIIGLDAGDTIALDGFAASTGTYVAGTGLILSDGTQSQTLDITGLFSTGDFTIANAGYTTDITAMVTQPSTISGVVTVGVTLGSGGYDSLLTVTSTGTISPAAAGTNGLYGAGGTVVNEGGIFGADGVADLNPPGAGGIGVFLAGATLNNAGTVTGGPGGGGMPGGGRGGAGVSLSSGLLANSGTIVGGIGAIDGGAGGSGGDGLDLSGGTATNSGTIIGGIGGAAMYGQTGSAAGAGVRQNGGALTNTGTIVGGVSDTAVKPGANGYGLVIDGGSVENRGLIIGGQGESSGGIGGRGVYLFGGAVTNDGIISGGAGSYLGGLGVRVLSGTLINQQDGSIDGGASVVQGQGGGAIVIAGPGTVENFGAIDGGIGDTSGDGVDLFAGSLMNAGLLDNGLFMDVYTTTSNGAATNTGTINAGAFVVGGSLANAAGGTINGGVNIGESSFESGTATNGGLINAAVGGVGVAIGAGSLTNTGSILGGAGGGGVTIYDGYLDNSGAIRAGAAAGGTAATSPGGVGVAATFFAAGVVNTGTILGGNGGFNNSGGDGLVLNGASAFNGGLIEGGFGRIGGDAVYVNGSFTNAGTVEAGQGATAGAAVRFGSRGGILTVDPGAVFDGAVAGAQASVELQLGTGAAGAIGSLDMGGSFSGVDNIVFDVGADWTLAGTTGELAGGQEIAGFNGPDTLLLEDFTATSDTYVVGTGLELANGASTETIELFGGFSTSSFIVSDTAAGTRIQLCYLAGTRILTPAGERAIETLRVGDAVITRFNGYRRVKWIGRQSFARRFVENNRDQIPVRILAGAFGPGLPRRDLAISPGHSMLIGDVLVLARTMVNGITVRQDACPEEIFYYQLEFETHDCVMAEDVWSESFCDYRDLRNQFHNVADFHALYPEHVTPTEHLLCAPRPEAGAALQAALRPLAARAAGMTRPGHLQGYVDEVTPASVTGWAQDVLNPELPVLLEVVGCGQLIGTVLACEFRGDLAAAKIGQGRCGFSYRAIRKISRAERETLQIRRAADGAAIAIGPHCERKTA